MKKILSVDDNDVNHQLLAAYLASYTVLLDTVEEYSQAEEKIKNEAFDIIFLDGQLKEGGVMNYGHNLILLIREWQKN